jgi:hypothetical protein
MVNRTKNDRTNRCPYIRKNHILYSKKTIPFTERGGLWGCEMSRIPYFLDSRLTDGG